MDFTSPLTTLDSISTPGSFYTAKDSPQAGDITAVSSPVDEPFGPRYREARQIPYELKQNLHIDLEEDRCSVSIQVFEGLLTDGNTLAPRGLATESKPARIAAPPSIAMFNTMTIHPSYTSRSTDRSSLHVSAQSLSYLRGLLKIVGPLNANLCAAFRFRGNGRGGGMRDSTDESTDDSDSINTKLAVEQSTWRLSPDFWALLGWAFRCAAAYPHRWPHYKVWLEYMLEVLEADWDERLALDHEEHERIESQGHCEYKLISESLLVAYLDDLRRERKNTLREVMRALMAFSDDDQSDKAIFKEVFSGETLVGPRMSKRKRAQTVDLEKGQFGDYLDGDEFDSEEESNGQAGPTTARRTGRRGRPPKEDSTAFCISDGVAESVSFRLRLFRLLSAASYYIPISLCPVDELYEKFADRVRLLPLPMFRLFIESHSTTLPDFAHVSLLRHVLDELVVNHPKTSDIDPDTDAQNGMSVLMMEKCFLPFAARTVTAEDNTKLSLVLENLLWFIHARHEIPYTANLRRAINQGIKAREERIKRRGAAADAAAARDALGRSARSLEVFIDIVEAQDV
ncbi:hypothetical protein B0T22DRAFT_15563 [Podospora appendiculata]|uniref:Uncharacterized protein n=1 Tax=Podospora appendiculata TaxID=314037 RepID=A0AAE0XFG7_9PEZI|nr:hypothetical protein B0T22DRAFT_15563 [Podospora appendiculata]